MLYSFCTLFLLYKLWRRKFLESLKCSFSLRLSSTKYSLATLTRKHRHSKHIRTFALNVMESKALGLQEKKTQNTSLTRKWILFGSAAFCCCWCGQQFRKVIEGCYTSALICNYRLFCVQQFVRSIKYSLPSRYKHICYPLPQPQYSVSVNIWGHLLSLESVSVVYSLLIRIIQIRQIRQIRQILHFYRFVL